jgi:hypothetical protein
MTRKREKVYGMMKKNRSITDKTNVQENCVRQTALPDRQYYN